MKKFLAVYTGSAASRGRSGWDQLSDDDRTAREQAGMQAWGEWMQANADTIVDAGGPLGKTKRISKDGLADTTNELAGYVIVRAESLAEAAARFTGHPHFAVFPGDAVEVMECLPIPGS